MIHSVGVFGSCVTRDLFNSKFCPNYKQYFKVVTDSQRSTIISFMADPVQIDFEDIKIDNPVSMRLLKEDFLKNKRFELFQIQPEYYVFDINFDVIFGIIILDDGNIITNNMWNLPLTSFYKKSNEWKKLTIFDNPTEYFSLFKDNVELFFDFLESNCPNMKIILNSFRNNYYYLDDNNRIKADDTFKQYSLKRNKYINKLETYIIDNYDIEILYTKDYFIDKDHLWGFSSHHFEKRYYDDKSCQLRKIIKYEENLKHNKELSKKLRFSQEKNRYLCIENKKLINQNENLEKSIFNRLFNKFLK